jgi:bleomycin hydrolase
MKNTILILALGILFVQGIFAQALTKDKGIFKTSAPGYFQTTILKGIEDFDSQKVTPKQSKTFVVDPSTLNIPASKDGFKSYWHNDPVSQGNTNTCWSFSTTSFLESEVYRTTGQQVRLSEIYTVYYEYLERAENWVRTRGNMTFGEGSEGNAVTKIWRKYGIVPLEAYSGLQPGQTFHNHAKMFEELKNYADFVKKNNIWDEAAIIINFRSIMNYYIGEPTTKITVNNKVMTPNEYMSNVLKINPNDYCDVLSYMQQPYWKLVEYEVPDNWWHDADYYNIPLDDFMTVIKKSIKAGYTMSIGGDVSEAGFLREANAAVIPSFDIPSDAIDENARQFRFSNETTTDDHGMHIVGFMEKDGVTCFLSRIQAQEAETVELKRIKTSVTISSMKIM